MIHFAIGSIVSHTLTVFNSVMLMSCFLNLNVAFNFDRLDNIEKNKRFLKCVNHLLLIAFKIPLCITVPFSQNSYLVFKIP